MCFLKEDSASPRFYIFSILLRGPNISPKERFTEYLTAYLTQNFSSRFSGMIPENLPVCLSHQLTKRLSHHFMGGLSDVAANQLSLQLTNRISQFVEECLSNRCPKDVLGQALRTLLEERLVTSPNIIPQEAYKMNFSIKVILLLKRKGCFYT